MVFCIGLFMTANGGQTNPQRPGDFEQAYREFKKYYENELRREGFVGSSFYLLQDNQIVAKEFYGLAHAEHGRAVDEQTIYHWASITMTFTGIAIMQLRDR